MITYALILIIVFCLVLIASAIFKKFPILSNINVQELKAEKQARVKTEILERRFQNRLTGIKKFFNTPAMIKFGGLLKNSYQKITNLEKKYKSEKNIQQHNNLNIFEKEDKIKEKLTQAENLINQNKLSEAENIYIETIALDKKNILAYLGLAKVYTLQKNYEHAKELYEHILKIDKNNDQLFIGLGNLSASQGDWEKAKNNYQKSIDMAQKKSEHYVDLATAHYKLGNPGRALTALRRASELEPKNPKYLDFLIEGAIINKNKILALDVLKKLEEINPDNNKLLEFKNKIKEL